MNQQNQNSEEYQAQLTNILSNFSKNDTQIIKQTEKIIETELETNYFNMIPTLTNIINAENASFSIRKISCLILKNSLSNSSIYINKWKTSSNEFKLQIKERILISLASSNKEIVKTVALVISTLCKLEFPSNNWKDIINSLLYAMNSSFPVDNNIASLLTLQYILQDILLSDLNSNEIDSIYAKIFENISSTNNNEVLIMYCKVIKELIPFSKHVFADPEKQNYVIKTIFSFFESPLFEIKMISIKSIIDCYKYFYNDISETHFSKIIKLTEYLFSNTAYFSDIENSNNINTKRVVDNITNKEVIVYSDKLTEQCLDLWVILAKTETKYTKITDLTGIHITKRSKKYCYNNYSKISNLVLNNFLATPKTDTEESWNIIKAGCAVLMSFSHCCPVSFINLIIEFITKHFVDDNLIIKERALLAFSCIIETEFKTKVRSYIESCFVTFIDMINSDQLRESVGFTYERIFKYFSDVFVKQKQKIGFYLDTLLNILLNYYNKDIKFSKYIANSICHLCINLPEGQYSK